MTKKHIDPPQRPARKRLPKRTGTIPADRIRQFDDSLLKLKLASPDERVEILTALSVDKLSTVERRQLLLAIDRYVIYKRSEMPQQVEAVLNLIVLLSATKELRLRSLSLFRQALDNMARKDVVSQMAPPLEALLKLFVPKSTRLSFSPELFLRVSAKVETTRDYKAVIDLASLGLFFFPFHGALRELHADFSMVKGHLESAERDYRLLIEQYPEQHAYRLDRAEALMRLEEYEAALSELFAYLNHHPDDIDALKSKADCLMQVGRGNEAIKVFTKVLEREGESAENFLWRAKAYDQLDMMEEAATDTDKALELDKDNQEIKQFRQSLLLRRQSYGFDDDLYNAFTKGDEDGFLGTPGIPETTFADIAGLDKPKQIIKETILYPLKYKELSEKYGKKAGGGLLLFGPPGCGKTLLAKGAAGECGVTFINVNLASILDKWVGNTEKAISMIFKSARRRSPSIIFLDEVDAIGGSRANLQAGWEKKLISQLLVELDGLTSDNTDIMLLAASNAPWEVDFALRRPGRLGNLVFVPPPDFSERLEIFKLYVSRKPFVDSGIDYEALAEKSNLFSADAIRQVVEDAATIPWRQAIETGKERPISQADLLEVLANAKQDLAEWQKLVTSYKEFAERSLKQPGIGFRRNPAPQQ